MRPLNHITKNLSVGNALSFIVALAKTAIFGMGSENLAEARNDICRGCDWYDVDNVSCGICGCGLDNTAKGKDKIFEKVYHKSSSCPIKRW